mgnify:CR=1 FL=1
MPQAFFGTFFRFERKYSPLRVGSPTVRAVVGASSPKKKSLQPSWRIALLAVGFPLPPEHRKSVSNTMVWQVPSVPERELLYIAACTLDPLLGALIEKSKRHPQSRKFDSRAIVARHASASSLLGRVHSLAALSPFPTNRNIPPHPKNFLVLRIQNNMSFSPFCLIS